MICYGMNKKLHHSSNILFAYIIIKLTYIAYMIVSSYQNVKLFYFD